jgi:hypothetical protein
MGLTTEIISKLEQVENVKVDRYMHWVKPLENAFIKNNLNGNWGEFKVHINVHVISYLTMTSDLLSHRFPEKILQDVQLEDMQQKVRELIEEIHQSGLPFEIQKFMLKHLYKVELALKEHLILGSEAVSDAIQSAFGYVILHSKEVEDSKENPIAQKFWQTMAQFALVLSVINGFNQLPKPMEKLIPDFSFNGGDINEKMDDTTE